MGTRHDVWFAIPSASVERCRKVLPVWREMGYKVAILQNHERGEVPADRVIWFDHYPGWAQSINILCRDVVPRDAGIVVSGGDDMLPDPHHTAGELAMQFFERFADGMGVMQPHGDDFLGAKFYCGSPFLGRGWIDRMYGGSGPMPGMYRHNWADNELYWLARCMGVLWSRDDLSHFHDHFTRSGAKKEGYWEANVERNDRTDVRTFIARSWLGFPGHEPTGAGAPRFDGARFEREYSGMAEMYLATRYGLSAGEGGCEARMEAALRACASRGERRVAIYGAGTHTRACPRALLAPPVHVACIIDDQPALQGTSLWNYAVLSVQEALSQRLDAVILSSNTQEEALAGRAAPLAAGGVRIVRLYGGTGVRQAVA